MSKTRITLALAATLTAGLALAGCSSTSGSMNGMDHGSSPTTSAIPADASFNTADVTFVNGMLPHHTQAVSMVDTLLQKDGIDPAVVDLATKIKAEQAPEITTMKGWLTSWKVSADSSGMGMDHGMGMMSDQDMADLDSATGTTAAKLFLTQMTAHHEGAIEMANAEVRDGKDADAITLAKNIVSSQNAEVQTMKTLLATL